MKYNVLVISSGGVNGFAILGCLQRLIDEKKLDDIDIFIGTSVGGIINYLICIGYTPSEIFVHLWQENIMNELKINCNPLNILKKEGIFNWKIIEHFLKKLTLLKIEKDEISLKELYEMKKKKLILCTYNFSKNIVEYINYENYPNINCIDALRMSSNIPLIFSNFKYNEDYYIDGGIYCSFPIHYINLSNYKIIGIKLNYKMNNNIDKLNLIDYIINLFLIPSFHLTKILNQEHEKNNTIITIDLDKDCGLNFFITISEAMDMFSIGYKYN